MHEFDEYGDGDEFYELSNLQKQFPNQLHNKALFDIVCRCQNLEVLGLHGTQRLDLKLLDWKPTNKGLRAIDLDRVTTPLETLIEILSPPEGISLSESILKNVILSEVDLETGSWEDTFTFLSGLPFNPEDPRYIRGHPSFTGMGRAWVDYSNVWSRTGQERVVLIQLVETLIAKAGGRDKYPDYWLEQHMIGLWNSQDDDDYKDVIMHLY